MEPISNTRTGNNPELYCLDLPTKPLTDPGQILITGASGYVGGRLVPELLARGYQVRLMVRGEPQVYQKIWPETEVVVADSSNVKQLAMALKDIDTAYYLIHSLRLGPYGFRRADIEAARTFRMAAEEAQVKRIIYLGGLGDIRNPLSLHLRSRIEIANELKKGRVPLTVLRAAIIIGSGSASYEIIQHLVQKLPIIFLPHWMKNRCQPIAIRDVIKYLVGVLEVPETAGRDFDIGGPDILTYEQMLKIIARIINKKIIFFSTFFSYIRFYCYLVSLFTPVPHQITQCLMEGLKNEVVVHDDAIRKLVPFEPLPYQEAIARALYWEKEDQVSTRWSDAYPAAHVLALKLYELKGKTTYQSRYSLLTYKNSTSLFQSMCRIGGKQGWFHYNWMWRLRGMVDRMLLGVGSARGRKRHSQLNINDVIDFWRVEDLIPDQRLLLRAEMKLPGKAWLEFHIEEEKGGRRLSVIPYFNTQTILGKMYWYIFLPFHHFIFKKLIVEIEKRS
jgi:uncharacterized protein YbjT (DUF2867 family)